MPPLIALCALLAAPPVPVAETDLTSAPLDGYRGIWFNIGQETPPYGPKYSGGLGTYTDHHRPMAVYAAAVRKTFFTYGAVDEASGDLQIAVGTFDHATGLVSRPTRALRWLNYRDPHCNAAIQLDDLGRLWLFVSGRGRGRAGYKLRSTEPYSAERFELASIEELTYPQPWYLPGRGFFHLFTKYTAGRELYFETSTPNGGAWTDDVLLAGFGGHYQVSAGRDGVIVTAFNFHPGGNVDKRTNVYVATTRDLGRTWTTVDGRLLDLPLRDKHNPALVENHEARGELAYVKDIQLDEAGRPMLVYGIARDYRAGPSGEPRELRFLRWTGDTWRNTLIGHTDHNYDSGSLYLEPGRLHLVIPSDPGPQPWGTGGEVVSWQSTDDGATWSRERAVTAGSERNQAYCRRPQNAADPFYCFWADGDPRTDGSKESRLYFCDHSGERVWRLPARMEADEQAPEQLP